jgi:hypothetical protein
MVFGVAGYAEIQANHARVIDLASGPPRRHAGCEPGVVAGNPVAEEIAVAAALRPPDLALLLVAGADGRPHGRLLARWALCSARDPHVREWYESRRRVRPGGQRRRLAVRPHVNPGAGARRGVSLRAQRRVLLSRRAARREFADIGRFSPTAKRSTARLLGRYVQYGQTTCGWSKTRSSAFRARHDSTALASGSA